MSEWQPIDTVPKTGYFVGLDKDGFPEVWSAYQYELARLSPSVDADMKRMAANLRFWCPLPDPPATTKPSFDRNPD